MTRQGWRDKLAPLWPGAAAKHRGLSPRVVDARPTHSEQQTWALFPKGPAPRVGTYGRAVLACNLLFTPVHALGCASVSSCCQTLPTLF